MRSPLTNQHIRNWSKIIKKPKWFYQNATRYLNTGQFSESRMCFKLFKIYMIFPVSFQRVQRKKNWRSIQFSDISSLNINKWSKYKSKSHHWQNLVFVPSQKHAYKAGIPWLMLTIPPLCLFVVTLIVCLTFMVLTARKKRQSEGAYNPSAQELSGARLEMDSMLKVPPEERLIWLQLINWRRSIWSVI